jgi:UDP-N-acetyl-D-galactosamine dehydrogenase
MELNNIKIVIVGLGYVGLPLAVEFSKKYNVIGFDLNPKRVSDLLNGIDHTLEVDPEILRNVSYSENNKDGIVFTHDLSQISTSNVFIVTVPTPINKYKTPDLGPLKKATNQIGDVLKIGDLVIYESTVFPGCTEEICVPILESKSNLKYNKDFFCGYSPERINPGDKVNTLTSIKKVTSGSNIEIAKFVDLLYSSIISAGTHLASSIKVAEASKAIENAQRDINISFVNELALMFDKMGIDTSDVIEAASTKWNFLKFKPGLVGGHCIGVDPYYLAYKAESLGYYPQVILSGRRVNDQMGVFVANKIIKLMINSGMPIKDANILILGFTFKENCPDIRNTKVIDIYSELKQFGTNVEIHDPWANSKDVKAEYNIDLQLDILSKKYHVLILAVAHTDFLNLNYLEFKNRGTLIFDTKSILDRKYIDGRL